MQALLRDFRAKLFDSNPTGARSSGEQPLRSELFTIQQLEAHAHALAKSHHNGAKGGRNQLLMRLRENEQVLLRTYELIREAASRKRRISPAAEWLLDNFYLIEDQVRTARRHLPRGYSLELPRLTAGPEAGYPRVYAIALELISHVDGRIDYANIRHFVAAYQSHTVMKLGELWAIPIMLRLALIENLRRVAFRITQVRYDREAAIEWAQLMIKTAEKSQADVLLVVADMARANLTFSNAFVAELSRQLQGQSQNFSIALGWIEQRLAEKGTSREQMIRDESQNQATDQVSIGNSIGSLRLLDTIDWPEFVENCSPVEQTLRGDPASVYALMDFRTRDRYRHVIELIARRSQMTEVQVAEHVIECARKTPTNDVKKHVGYYLIDKGRSELEQAVNARTPLAVTVGKSLRAHPLFFYLGSVVVLTVWYTFWGMAHVRTFSMAFRSVFAALFILMTSQFSISMINWLASLFVLPQRLPRLDFSKGIPPDYHAIVAVPTMLTSIESIDDLLEKLEVRYLGNRDKSLHFALLSDFKDAPAQTLPGDRELLEHAAAGITALNDRYSPGHNEMFFLFHRPRLWNAREKCWIGYERKRGKLADFNHFLQKVGAAVEGKGEGEGEANGARFCRIVGDFSALKQIKFVITLDSDTQLPSESAQELVAAMAHPLNRPVYDAKLGRVVRGYSILQPCAAINLPSAQRSWFARLFAGEAGIDPYTQVSSDVYQDLFEEGSFIGKGIYDLNAFEQALDGRLPENRILSHDLIEGCYARAGLLTDVQIFEDFPSRYMADVARRHRWIRGDWQIVRWLFSTVPVFSPPGEKKGWRQKRACNPISMLSQWKILDNLRRSLVPIAILAALILSWLCLPRPGIWTACILLVPAFPFILELFAALFNIEKTVSIRQHLYGFSKVCIQGGARILLTIAFVPHEARISADAILRTLVRLFLTRRRLLEWTTASEAEKSSSTSLASTIRDMWIAPALAITLLACLADLRLPALAVAAPILFLWLLAPLAASLISRPIVQRQQKVSPVHMRLLHKTARKTWAFFDRFVTKSENWLPPDNFQEIPAPVIAHRTSPTNIGMSLLANLAAYDLGYIPMRVLLSRTQGTLASLETMERFRGHFFNWYDTLTLKPMLPIYLSTVDSGNLAGHLMTLRRGLLELQDQPVLTTQMQSGLLDTLEVITDQIERGKATGQPASTELEGLKILLQRFPGDSLLSVAGALSEIKRSAERLAACPAVSVDEELRSWVAAMAQQAGAFSDEIEFLSVKVAPEESTAVPENALFAPLTRILSKPDYSLTPRELAGLRVTLLPELERHIAVLDEKEPEYAALKTLHGKLVESAFRCAQLIAQTEALAEQCLQFGTMDFTFLYDPSHKLFSIGFNVSEHRLDESFYDLLASEARLTSFLAIAQGQVGQEHWFALGRQVTGVGVAPTLISWSGSMFEYLMPLLVMPNYENTLLDQSYKGTVARQIEYAGKRGVPWGISESGYNLTDAQSNYQYRAFGVPGLGLKRGLSEDLVIAPYATVMAVMIFPEDACRNLKRLEDEGRTGAYGFYEAVDYTPSRLPRGQQSVTIQSYMAHHQGMALLALNYFLMGRPMQRRFVSEPLFKMADLLLHERVSKNTGQIFPHAAESAQAPRQEVEGAGLLRIAKDPSHPIPDLQLLSNGRYHVMINSAGSGYSRCKDASVTRWREDAMRDSYGIFCYLREPATGEVWSNTHQPTLRAAESYEAIFSQGRAEFRRSDRQIDVHTEISVSAEDDIEVRRISITNQSLLVRTIELTSYAEVVIAPAGADAAHPAFSNLFVQTHLDPERHSIYCVRRPRSPGDQLPVMLHSMWVRNHEIGQPSFETDRAAFIGRCNDVSEPDALRTPKLTGSHGSVLDPIVCIRRTVRLDPHEVARIDLICGVAASRDEAVMLADKYCEQRLADRVFETGWTQSQVSLRQLNATESDAQLYGRLAGSIVFASPHRRASAAILGKNCRAQSALWSYGISGDLPIIMLRISDPERIALVREVVQAHAYWRMKGLLVDLVITNDDPSVYRQALYDQIMMTIAARSQEQMLDKPGGIFVRRAEQISDADRILLQTAARVVLLDSEGTLKEQVERKLRREFALPRLEPSAARGRRNVIETNPSLNSITDGMQSLRESELLFFNGIGGFSRDGKEYVIRLGERQTTPAPWINVLANPTFGTVVSESGSAYTWLENSHEYRLTPWNNDPVSDPSGEAFYLRDEESGLYWSPSPLPARGRSDYLVRHGFGYSVFHSCENGIAAELCVYVALDAPVKFMSVKIHNVSGRARRLSLTGYFEWVLGELRSKNQMYVITEYDKATGAVLASNPYSGEFPKRIAYVAVTEPAHTVSGDRGEFIGRNGTLAKPAAMSRVRLSGKVGAGLDPCAAVQVPLTIAAGQSCDIVFQLGVGRDAEDVADLLKRFCSVSGARNALESVQKYWRDTLGAVQVETPDPSLNLLVNGWLLYQTLCCRMWGRTGFYQSGGAFGFRDQLQDSLALVHAQPALTREHLLRAAQHQYREGDVQHWWHPPAGRGVRTHFSDDYLWLPYAVCHYVRKTGDTGVLDEQAGFLEGRPVNAEEEAYYDLPLISEEKATLYQHCVRAIENGLKFGSHGLPLMGCGDWNDGMNRVGLHGNGESVWLGFFLVDVLNQFVRLAGQKNDHAFAQRCTSIASELQASIEANAWDGNWYKRAYFDSGEPLGSATNDQCQIDALPQSWSVLSGPGAGDEVRASRSKTAMEAVDNRLVKRPERLIQLFDPPFDHPAQDPGYIQGYAPGVRENGGQYTHAALWTIMAFAKLRDTRAWELFALINPVNHGRTPDEIGVYKVEPYVVAADVYAVSPHEGRGGWTWYTGSAGWMYRLATESLLGLKVEKEKLTFEPFVPIEWNEFKLSYRYRETLYRIAITKSRGEKQIFLDGAAQTENFITLADDKVEHTVEARIL